MRAEDRRELIIGAAMGVFGDYGYVGTTTDQVAKAAGVSQPYVVRIFGTKENLFLEVLERALATLMSDFRRALADAGDVPLYVRLGRAYFNLLSNRGLLLSLMHGFVLGSDPKIGARAREGYLEVYTFLRDEAGFGSSDAMQFLANGMLINTMVGLRMGDEYETNPVARELLQVAFPEKLDLLLELGKANKPDGA